MRTLRRLLAPTAWVFYLVLVFEILYMISPFALYYYSSYAPVLNLLDHSAWTAWLTGFFLPHISVTTSYPLNHLHDVGELLIGLGLLLFLIGFVQIYWAKLRRSGAVTRGLYAYVRHPQYLALAIMGLGTLLVWPRFLVLIAYVTMLFLYRMLARSEEENCLRKYGESYHAYLERTGRFLPKAWTRWFPAVLPQSGGLRVLAGLVLYAALVVGAVVVGNGLRSYSVAHLRAYYDDNVAVLSPAPLSDRELNSTYALASSNAEVRQRLEAIGPEAKLLVYVLPSDWYLADLPVESLSVQQWQKLGGHHTPTNFDRGSYKVLFTRALSYAPDSRGSDIVKHAYGRDALLLVRVNLESERVSAVEVPASQLLWGNIPTPMF
jgi:protein-S-isoprenylcysteine O-methyltransferase Ste14